MSRTEYVASKPTSELPFPRTRLLGTPVARQSYNSPQPGPSPYPHHHVSQTSPDGGWPAAVWRPRAVGARNHAPLRARALGRGHEPEAGAPGGAVATFR